VGQIVTIVLWVIIAMELNVFHSLIACLNIATNLDNVLTLAFNVQIKHKVYFVMVLHAKKTSIALMTIVLIMNALPYQMKVFLSGIS
jgi:hypothetical protein